MFLEIKNRVIFMQNIRLKQLKTNNVNDIII